MRKNIFKDDNEGSKTRATLVTVSKEGSVSKILQKNSIIVAEWMVYTDMTDNSVGEVCKSPKTQNILNVFKTLIHCLKI